MKRISHLFLSVGFIVVVSCSYGLAIEPPPNLAVGSTILVKPHLTNSPIHIPAGHFSTPYTISQSNTEYILDGNITADSTAFYIQANYVALNLNGHTITYNNSSAGEGVYVNSYSQHDIAIHNGTITQGSAASEGNESGVGNNPIRSTEDTNIQIADMTLNYNGRDVGGIYLEDTGHIIESCVLNDNWGYGTFKNRHQGVKAIKVEGDGVIVRNNTLNNVRQIGIAGNGNMQAYGNTINIKSKATNSSGIASWSGDEIYNNTITGVGEHPIGIYVSGPGGGEVYGNTIDVQVTARGDEYATSAALGIRLTYGEPTNWDIHHNTITVHTDKDYTEGVWSSSGNPVATLEAQGKGLHAGLVAGATVTIRDNDVTMIDADGTSDISVGIECSEPEDGNSEGLFFINNTVRANRANVFVGSGYNPCNGYPLFKGNTFIKTGNLSSYNTIERGLGGYYTGEARFVDNVYQDGAALTSRELFPGNSNSEVSIYFGNEVDGVDKYYMQIHDNGGSSSSEIQINYDPMITLPY